MTKTLERKYIFTATLAVTILLVILLGVINVANVVSVLTEVDRKLDVVLAIDGQPEDPRGFGQPPRPDRAESLAGPAFMRKNDYDTFMSSNFWLVRFDVEGNAFLTDVSRSSTVTDVEAQDLARSVLESGSVDGRRGIYRYRVGESPRDGGKAVVFLDTSDEVANILRVLFYSAATGAACWLVMLPIVIFLSRKAIRPIADNIDRQRRFITDAGHEINTPLAIIQSNTEAMELIQGESKWSRNIRQQTARLSGFMKNLLLLARMDEGAAALHPERLRLDQLVVEAVEPFEEPFSHKGAAFSATMGGEVFVTADRSQVSQLLSILLENALKYVDEGGSVCVTLGQHDGAAVLAVQNTCEELPEGPLDKLFDRFYRSDTARTQKSGGYGIGLSVAKAIADSNGASISASVKDPRTISFEVSFKAR